MTHEIELEGYYPKILGSPMRMLCLGTKASYGMEVLHFRRGTGWDGLALDVTFTPDPQAEGTTVLADAGDTVAVPPAATAQATNSGSVTVRGVRDGVQCIRKLLLRGGVALRHQYNVGVAAAKGLFDGGGKGFPVELLPGLLNLQQRYF